MFGGSLLILTTVDKILFILIYFYVFSCLLYMIDVYMVRLINLLQPWSVCICKTNYTTSKSIIFFSFFTLHYAFKSAEHQPSNSCLIFCSLC
ncbi:hypothetical protein CICLE_v10006325mg [Citrus x clementina]|uniref:Uncharacterized protein n=2 Tax=Citrus TaxID=2706 RepID=A0A067EY22_CITSI|nr:hypothetical protein CICLE_v10006325mg [Citrus x clementina]KDO56122.1 hypothetical protein CISIN_1g039217mg [Citrus sinensis]